jgi:uncharacterized protein (TIGR02453 family)
VTAPARTAEERSFSPELFAFLRELREHNDREWFKARKDRYEAVAKEPALAFVEDCAHLLPLVSPHLVADEKSLFRIHRDTRFAKDKSPYKTQAGIYFRHERSREAYSPGFYLHLEPRNVFAGGGMWHPDTKTAHTVREAIARDPDGWAEAKQGLELAAGESLKRVPPAFDKDHPHAEDLKRKDFAAIRRFTQKEATTAGFLDRYEAACVSFTPLMRFLCRAVGVPY